MAAPHELPSSSLRPIDRIDWSAQMRHLRCLWQRRLLWRSCLLRSCLTWPKPLTWLMVHPKI